MNKNNNRLSLFCWNIGNPSIERAERQAKWLVNINSDIFVLTETKNSKGCLFIEDYFKNKNYNVVFEKPKNNEYGAMIVSKHQIEPILFYDYNDNLTARVVSVRTSLNKKKIDIIGTYIPSRDKSPKKVKRKKIFLKNLKEKFELYNKDSDIIFCGDFNILEPNHIPHYSFFEEWEYSFYSFLKEYGFFDSFRHLNSDKKEYSWVGRTGNGYRYDHCFTSKRLISSVKSCYYLHTPKEEKLSDHSAIIIEIHST
ncbi:MAG: endonuclease/exonuclease/phosphatase family protein [Candidatus Pacebacteria bacterium]|nr:endonuclease/exonuclease/phosphatase family protein [Candidatus Paceibacterota bacterium]